MKIHRTLVSIAAATTLSIFSGSLGTQELAAQGCFNCDLNTFTCITHVLLGKTVCQDIPGVFCGLSGSQCIGKPGSVAAIKSDGSVRSVNGSAGHPSSVALDRQAGVRFAVARSGSRLEVKRSCTGIILGRYYPPNLVAQIEAQSKKIVL
jgi:hypothetical protein